MQGLAFEIRHSDGRVEQLRVEASRALLGSGAHCEIRLPLDQAANEHVVVTSSAGGIVAEAISFNPPATINDTPIHRSPITEGAVLGIGQTKIVVTAVEIGEGAAVGKKKEEKTSPMTYVLAAVAVPVSLYILLTDDPSDLPLAAPEEAPALFGEAVSKCPQTAKGPALALARDKVTLADAKRERRPFHVRDGVLAVSLFETAAACFRSGGEKAEAERASRDAAKLRAVVDEDYRTHRLRLELALSTEDHRTAQKEARVLLDLTAGIQSEYVTWLDNLDRRLRLKFGAEDR